MRNSRLLTVFIFLFFLSFSMFIACGDDDDDDDSNGALPGDGDSNSIACSDACEGLFDCGGSLYYEDIDQCLDYCGDWEETSIECAECFFECFDGYATCVGSINCLIECAYGDCLEEMEDWLEWLEG